MRHFSLSFQLHPAYIAPEYFDALDISFYTGTEKMNPHNGSIYTDRVNYRGILTSVIYIEITLHTCIQFPWYMIGAAYFFSETTKHELRSKIVVAGNNVPFLYGLNRNDLIGL